MALLFGFGVNAQTLSTETFNEADENLPDVGTILNVPIDVTDIGEIFTLTVYLEYDDVVLDYTGFADPIPGVTVSAEGNGGVPLGIVKVIVSNFPAVTTIDDGKIVDLQFEYLGGYSNLTFHTIETGAYISNILDPNYGLTNFHDGDVTNGAVEGFFENTISGGDWHTASNWSLETVPRADHIVTVIAGTETTVDAAATAYSITVATGGQLTIRNGNIDVGSIDD